MFYIPKIYFVPAPYLQETLTEFPVNKTTLPLAGLRYFALNQAAPDI